MVGVQALPEVVDLAARKRRVAGAHQGFGGFRCLFAIDQFGLMARVVLKNWGVSHTGDFGDIVYNMIDIGLMKKSDSDRREDFDGVYDFIEAFDRHFQISGGS